MDSAKTAVKEVSAKELDKLIMNHVWGSAGVGLIPIPLADMIALTAIQINLVRKIANMYDIPFFKDKVKNILGALIGSIIPSSLGAPLSASIGKTIPIIGQIAGALTMPAISGASTYAVGKVFVQHFATGGTLLTFDPEKVKAYYAEMIREGKELISDLKENKAKTPETAAKPDTAESKEPDMTTPGQAEAKAADLGADSEVNPSPSAESEKKSAGVKKKDLEKNSETRSASEMMS